MTNERTGQDNGLQVTPEITALQTPEYLRQERLSHIAERMQGVFKNRRYGFISFDQFPGVEGSREVVFHTHPYVRHKGMAEIGQIGVTIVEKVKGQGTTIVEYTDIPDSDEADEIIRIQTKNNTSRLTLTFGKIDGQWILQSEEMLDHRLGATKEEIERSLEAAGAVVENAYDKRGVLEDVIGTLNASRRLLPQQEATLADKIDADKRKKRIRQNDAKRIEGSKYGGWTGSPFYEGMGFSEAPYFYPEESSVGHALKRLERHAWQNERMHVLNATVNEMLQRPEVTVDDSGMKRGAIVAAGDEQRERALNDLIFEMALEKCAAIERAYNDGGLNEEVLHFAQELYQAARDRYIAGPAY